MAPGSTILCHPIKFILSFCISGSFNACCVTKESMGVERITVPLMDIYTFILILLKTKIRK